MEQKPQAEQNTVKNSAQEPALEYVEMTQSTEVSEQQLAMLDVGEENTKDSLEIVEEQDVEKEPETKEEVAEDSPPLEEVVAQESIPASVADEAPAAVEAAKADTPSESEADDGGISASTWLWGIAGAGALAYGLDSDKAAPEAPSISLATDSGTAGDGLTNAGVVSVTGLEDGASWEYSLDGGTTWNAGSGNSVIITNDGSYQVIVRQDNGKVSENSATLNITIDSTSPTLLSETSVANQNENSAVGTVVYTVSVDDASGVVFSLKEGSDAALSIDSASGEVTLVASPNFEVATSHAFTLVATDAAGNVTEQALVLNINNLDEVAPTITSGDPLSVGDDVTAGTVVYTVTSDDSADISGGVIYTLKEGSDPALTINGGTGEVSLLASPDYQTATSHAFTVVATDAAGNSSEKSLVLNIDDKTAPTTSLVDGDSVAGTLTVSFSESMNVASLPSASDFVINQGTTIVAITDIAFDGNQLVLSVPTLTSGSVQVEYIGTSLQDASGNALENFTQIVVSDGYIKGAQVYLDANNDGIATADELLEGVTTDAQGQVILNGAVADGNLIIKGGINTDTGAVNKLTLSAPSGYKVINPLTTLVKAVQSASGTALTQAEAENVVAKSLGITLNAGETLSNFDPESNASTTGLQAKKAVAQVAVILEAAITSASPGNSEAVETQVAAKLADVLIAAQQSAPDTAVTFDATVITEVFKAEDGSSVVSSEASTLVTTSVEAITQAATLEEVVVEQAKAMDKIAPLAASVIMDPASDSAALDNVTSETMLNLVVTFAQDDLAGGGVVAGDVLTVTANGAVVGTYTVTTSDVAAGKASWMSAALADGDVAYSVSISDRAGNVSPASNLLSVTIDTTAPSITSADIVADANENTAIGTLIYTAASSDANADLGLVYSLKAGSDPALTIDAATGEVSLLASPDFETAQSHTFTVVSTDLAGNSSEKTLTVNILDIDEVAPTITSSATASNIDENSGPEQVIYTATATDDADISAGFTFALKEGSPSVLSINAQTGAVTLASDPDHETDSSYDFTIVVTDAAGNSSEQAVSLVINDLDDSDPIITSASTLSVDENTSAGSTLYTATADDSGDDVSGGVTFSLKAGSDSALSINAETGVVTSSAALDHEIQDSYAFTVLATDAAGNVGEQAVTFSVTDLNEAPTSTAISDQVVVTDLAFSSDLSKSFIDQDDGDVLTFALTAGELPSGLSLSETGVISGTATAEFDNASFTITATDAGGLTKNQTFSLKVVAAPVVESLIVGDSQTPSDAAKLGDVITIELVMSEAFVLDTTGGTPTIGVLFGDSTTEVIGTYALTSGNNLAFTVTAPAGNAESVSLGSISLNGATLVGTLSEQPWETSSVGQSTSYILDNAAPVFTSATAASVDENTAVGSEVYAASVDDVVGGITFSLKSGSDAALTINTSSGVVSLLASPDFETATSHAFTVLATDALGNQSEQAVTLSVNNLDEVAPAITSGVTVASIDENTAVGTTVYKASSDDTDDISGGVSYSLKLGSDPALSIDADTGEVTLLASPDHETAQKLEFTVVATDAAGNSSELALTLNINDLDEVAPTITSGATATSIDENSGAQQVVYNVTATDDGDVSGGVSYSLKEGAPSQLSIDASSGAVTLAVDPDHETVANYTFTVIAKDAAGNASEKEVTLNIKDLDDTAPSVTSSATVSVDENTAAGATLYTAIADDSADVSDGVSFSLKAGSDSVLSINAETGVVTSSAALDHETEDSYTFTVVATDAAGNVGEQAVTLSVTDLNETPVASSINDIVAVTDQLLSVNLAASFSDVDDGDSLTYAVSGSLPEGLSLNSATGVLTGTAVNDVAKTSFDVTATDSGGLTVTQSFNLSVVSAPVIDSISVEGANGAIAGVQDESVTITVAMSEAFTLNTSGGTPSLGLIYGDSTTEVLATYVSNDGQLITFLADNPSGNASSISVGSISLNGAVLTGTTSGQSWQTSVVGQAADYLLDNEAPTITSLATGNVHAYWPVGDAIYVASSNDASNVTYSLGVGSDPEVSIDSVTGEVTLAIMPVDVVDATDFIFTVVATDALSNATTKEVTVIIDAAQSVSGPGIQQLGGVILDAVDNLDGSTYTLEFYVSDDVKSVFASGIGNIDLVFNYSASDFDPIALSDISSYFAISSSNLQTPGKIVFGGLDLTPYDVMSAEPFLSIVVTPLSEDSITVSVTDVIFEVTDMDDTVVVYGDPNIVVGDSDSDAYILAGGDVDLTTGGGADVLVLTKATGFDFYIQDFESGADSIEFGPLLSGLGYTSVSDQVTDAVDFVATELVTNPAEILALIESNDTSLDNMFGSAPVVEDGVAKLFFDANPQAGIVDIETFDLNIGSAVVDIDDGDITGFIA